MLWDAHACIQQTNDPILHDPDHRHRTPPMKMLLKRPRYLIRRCLWYRQSWSGRQLLVESLAIFAASVGLREWHHDFLNRR
jgi:hypothetical protein